MQNVLFFAFFLLNFIVLLKNHSKGLMYFCAIMLICPDFRLSGIALSYDIIFLVVIIAVTVLRRKAIITVPIATDKGIADLYIVTVIIFFLSTLLSAVIFQASIQIIRLFGVFKFAAILLMLVKGLDHEDIYDLYDCFFSLLLVVNTVAVIVQLLLPSSINLFYSLYYQESYTPLLTMLQMGRFSRAFGTFPSPVLLGTWALIAFAFYFGGFVDGKEQRGAIIKICLSLLCGISALSKVAILGFPIIFLVGFTVMHTRKIKTKRLLRIWQTLGIIIVLVVTSVLILRWLDYPIVWYLNFVKDPFSALETRYGSTSSNLDVVMCAIKESWLFGYGATNPKNIFVGDSEYLASMYNIGVLGSFFMVILFTRALKKSNMVIRLCVLSILCAGFALPTAYSAVSAVILPLVSLNKSGIVLNNCWSRPSSNLVGESVNRNA